MKSKELKVYNLPNDRQINQTIDAKPYDLMIITLSAGIIISFLENLTAVGITVTVISVFCLLFLPKRILMEFSDDYAVLYNRADHNECLMIYYEDVLSWKYQRGVTYDELKISLEDGSSASVEAFSRFRFESVMNLYLREKKVKNTRK